MSSQPSLIFAREEYVQALRAALPAVLVVRSRAELVAAMKHRSLASAFIDFDLLPHLDGLTFDVPIVVLVDGSLSTAIDLLGRRPWLSHLVHVSMLSSPLAGEILELLVARIKQGLEQPVLGAPGDGRVALLASSARREARFERMREFFATHDVTERVVASLQEIAEELVMNALYDAPFENGYFKESVPRTDEIELPPEHACEISYGFDHGSAFIRVRDPFGALGRDRLLEVLSRCSSSTVDLDESRGGAGLGLWRVFSKASVIVITVIPGRLTDILVRIETKPRRGAVGRAFAVHLFFPDRHALDGAQGRFAADHDYDLVDESFTALREGSFFDADSITPTP